MTPTATLSATTADGVTLALRRHRPDGAARAACLCVHAMMASGRTFERGGFADHLAAQGVDTFVLDLRGHGDSVPPRPESDRGWCFDDYVELDLPAAWTQVARTAGIAPADLCYVGHSLGGLAGLAAFGTGALPPPRRIALIATSVWLPGHRGSRSRKMIMRLFHLAARPLGYAPIRALGLGSDNEPRAYVEQLAGWATGGRWTSRTGVDYMPLLSTIQSPVLALSGDGDRLCLARDAEVILSRLSGRLPLRRVGRDHGDPIDPDHFALLLRPELARSWTELAAFVTAS